MLDFLTITQRSTKSRTEYGPKFKVCASSDLMIRGGDFYCIWDEKRGLWSTKEEDAVRLIDNEIDEYSKTHPDAGQPMYMWDGDSGSIDRWHKYCQKQMWDNFHQLDDKLIFSNMTPKREDYASKRLPYPLEPGSYESWDKLVGTLYTEPERRKLEWAIGSIITGDSRFIQKFLVLYGAMGTGKSTVLKIIEMLFEGYCSVFDAKALGSGSNQFALEAFKDNPLVAIQHDGDLSRIEDNTRLNSLVSHEVMTVNEKFKSTYATSFRSFLFMGTNKPVKITDSRSGLLRRLIDVEPSGKKVPVREYNRLMRQIPFELGAIAWHCKEVYEEDPEYYDDYVPVRMLGATNDFFNFLIDAYPVFKKADGTSLKAAWEMYKTWVEESKVAYPYPLRVFKEELKDYFWDFEELFDDGENGRVRCYYSHLKIEKFKDQIPNEPVKKKEPKPLESWIEFKEQPSLLDIECKDCPAQYAKDDKPTMKWEKVKTVLADLDTSKVHYVKVPEAHIVIDFDIPDETGKKCYAKNLEAASKWPKTYAELSKSGEGIHLHYLYSGDVSKLSRVVDEHIELKVFTGLSSLRRKLTKCNDIPITRISSGLPLKGEKQMVDFEGVKSEKQIRTLIKNNLQKKYHADTSSSINLIAKVLDDAYSSGIKYDVSDMQGAVLAFAANSTNQADRCIKMVAKMHFQSEDIGDGVEEKSKPRVFFDIESFPNLMLVSWKFAEDDIETFDEYRERLLAGKLKPVMRMYNPSPQELEELFKYNLVGFNNLGYDNQMVYAAYIGYTPSECNKLSDSIINKGIRTNFRESKNLSETDIYDFASAGNKKSLKKLEFEMGIPHQELGLPWDKPVPEDLWGKVGDYCDWDVYATECAFYYLEADWIARQILADLAGATTNDSTNDLTKKIIFGNNRNPQSAFLYRNLAEPVKELPYDVTQFLNKACPEMMHWWAVNSDSKLPYFPGYKFEFGKSTYRGEEVGEGGRVAAEPGMHGWDALLDVYSMHPHSTIAECLFGVEFTTRFMELVEGRGVIKHEEWEELNNLLDGKLTKYIKWIDDGKITSKQLANALKTAINSVYGLTAAKFPNPFKDPRNVDNIVAKRGALFMMDLEYEVKTRGFTVAHIKTDSIKIPNATPEIIQFVMDFGKRYGYTFEHEATYERMCLVNDAVYIARYATAEDCMRLYGYVPGDNKKHGGEWTATGKQFQVPYVFKTLFSKEPIRFEDMCEVLSVKTALYLRENENDPEFVGRVGQFCPIKPGHGGKELLRESKDADGNVKYGAATGTKGYFWLESEVVRQLGKEDDIDRSYYDDMVTKAVETISQFGDFERFVDLDHPYPTETFSTPCHCTEFSDCLSCPMFHAREPQEGPDICEKGFFVDDVLPF